MQTLRRARRESLTSVSTNKSLESIGMGRLLSAEMICSARARASSREKDTARRYIRGSEYFRVSRSLPAKQRGRVVNVASTTIYRVVPCVPDGAFYTVTEN